MRPIPQALRTKLLNRFKADSTDSMPAVRLVATQTSVNTLLSEPIHEDIAPALGDVTVRQYIGESDLSCAYAICLDDGIANVYRRQFPASMDYKWEFNWRYGAADDVAIEYDGEWILDATATWYYLRTEEFPYIFTVESGNLYVQYWRDSTTRIQLASGVSQISSCKGWQNNIDIDLDQGLIIGYLKNGEVFYRAYCTQDDGTKVWEAEHKVEELGTGNTTLSVIRTNDFRIGFLTENNGEMLLCLTYRNYAGMSVRPETIHANAVAGFEYPRRAEIRAFAPRERITAECSNPFFNLDTVPESEEISVLSTERLNRTGAFDSYGCRFYLSKPLFGMIPQQFIDGASVSVLNGGETSTVGVSGADYDAEHNCITLYFASDIRRTCQLTVTTVSSRALSYERVQTEKWFIPGFSAVFLAETQRIDGYDRAYVSAAVDADFWVEAVVFTSTYNRESASTAVTATFVLTPVSTLPI